MQKQLKLELNAMQTGVEISTNNQNASSTMRPKYNCVPNGALNLNFLSPNLKRKFGRQFSTPRKMLPQVDLAGTERVQFCMFSEWCPSRCLSLRGLLRIRWDERLQQEKYCIEHNAFSDGDNCILEKKQRITAHGQAALSIKRNVVTTSIIFCPRS